jgi:hypothetical protein
MVNVTESFIEKYIHSDHQSQTISEKLFPEMLNYLDFIDEEMVAIEIKNISLDEFYTTPYWLIIAAWVRKQSNYKCKRCGRAGFVIHHLHYKNHGYELRFWESDLVCLCEQCHRRDHGHFVKRSGNIPLKNYRLTSVLDYLYQKEID